MVAAEIRNALDGIMEHRRGGLALCYAFDRDAESFVAGATKSVAKCVAWTTTFMSGRHSSYLIRQRARILVAFCGGIKKLLNCCCRL